MIICSSCETGQFVHIIGSKIRYKDDELVELKEAYRCTMCESSGSYIYHRTEGDRIMGDMTVSCDRPRVSP